MKARIAVCGLLLGLMGVLFPGATFAQEASDNASVTAQLNDVRPIVAQIIRDADQLKGFSLTNGPSWQTHMAVLGKIRQDVNKMQEYMRGLQAHRASASPWQQEAIDRVSSLANDLATSMNSTIDQLNKSKSRPIASPYPEFLRANAQIARDLADEINGAIDYRQTRSKMESLQKQLPE
jgi:hypothetical protein